MKNTPRILIFISALLLVSLYFLPMWKITLLAPQYPDGVQMHIYIDKIGGDTPGTLQNVNILNHYIGMKKIEPDSIPELTYMPWIVAFFIVTAVLTAILNKKWMYFTWIILLIGTLIVGLYDFYLWEYDYGHNLDPNAPMQFDDESFQPPLIGKKEIINFTAYSLPHFGGYLMIVSVILGLIAAFLKSKIRS